MLFCDLMYGKYFSMGLVLVQFIAKMSDEHRDY